MFFPQSYYAMYVAKRSTYILNAVEKGHRESENMSALPGLKSVFHYLIGQREDGGTTHRLQLWN